MSAECNYEKAKLPTKATKKLYGTKQTTGSGVYDSLRIMVYVQRKPEARILVNGRKGGIRLCYMKLLVMKREETYEGINVARGRDNVVRLRHDAEGL
ncbi:unnamed protein product [Somion occarium]|uniref:Uncharacterized protein n=1 Tax=Somion occarium TaxID=3059160 RepID=A0ABP1D5P7_9APHY